VEREGGRKEGRKGEGRGEREGIFINKVTIKLNNYPGQLF